MNFLKKNSWTLDLAKIPSYVEWNGDWKYEIDREMIRLILECEELDKDGNPVITDKMKTHFKNNIVDKLRNGELHIEWSARYGGLGRRYSARDPEDPDPFSSAGNLGSHAKVIKNTIFHYQGWVDYDMIKGHPTLLLAMAKHTKLTGGLPAIERYVADFDTLAEEMIEHYSAEGDNEEETEKFRLTKDDIKDLHNRTIYGGGHDKWVKKIEKGDEKKGKLPKPCNPVKHPKYTEFYNDIKRVIGLVYDNNPDLVAKVCINPPAPKPPLELWQKQNRTMSYFCGILENECLKHAYKYGVENGLFKPRRIDLCYDGFSAPSPPPFTDMPFHINEMNNYILEKTGFAVKMKVKPFDKVVQSLLDARRAVPNAVPAEAVVELVVEGTENVSAEASNTDQEYVDWKIRFENEWCKIKNTAIFMRKFCEDGVFKKFVFQDKKKLVIAYEHECYTKTLDNGKEKKIKYINEWIEDPTQITYEDVGVYPPPLVCPTNVFNLWIPSPYESQPFENDTDPDIDHDAVKLFIQHIDILCGRDEKQTDWLCSWFAHSLQKPCEKPEHALNLIGNQGIGKSTILNTFSKLYGAGKTLETQNPERDCWGSFNSAMTNAFLVILSETDKRNAFGADGKIKALITDYPMWINPKGKDQFEIISYHRLIQLTNNIDPTRTSKDDRRNWILRCNDELKGNTEYFKKINEALVRPNALRSIYWSFKKLDISQWNFRCVPRTEYHETIIEYSRNPLTIFLEAFTIQRFQLKECEITGPELLKEFRLWRETTGYKFEDSMNEGALLKALKIGCGLPKNAIVRSEKRTKSGYTQTINLEILKEYFHIACIFTGDKQVNTEQEKEVITEPKPEPVKPKKVIRKATKSEEKV
jgi:hypothetical protein